MTDGPEPALQIFTDASWNAQKESRGSWGAVIVWQAGGESHHETHQGEFKKRCPCTTTAELWAVANGLHIAIAAGHVERDQHLHVLTDNLAVAEVLAGWSKFAVKKREKFKRGLDAVRECMADLDRRGITVAFSWTPGHCHRDGDPEGTPAFYNRLADTAARRANTYSQATAKRRRKARRAKERGTVDQALAAHGLGLPCDTELRAWAINMRLHKMEPGSPKAVRLLQKAPEKFRHGPPHPRAFAHDPDPVVRQAARNAQSAMHHLAQGTAPTRARKATVKTWTVDPAKFAVPDDPADWQGWQGASYGA